MSRCIYCLEKKTEDHFRKAEHVMPQSFGKFEGNFTLHGVVCDECNHYFGSTLELALGRDTFEGHLRFRHGVKDPADFKPFRNKRVTFKVTEGPFAGCHAYTEYVEQVGGIQVFYMPQVGFLMSPANRHEYFLSTEIPTIEELRIKGFVGNTPRSIMTLRMEPDEAQRVLAEKGITLNIQGEVPQDESRTDIAWKCRSPSMTL